jgi:copper transporter 1
MASLLMRLLAFSQVFFVVVMAQQDLDNTFCPLCDMDIVPSLNQTLRGNQAVYACEMAGHLATIRDPTVRT